MGIGTALVEHPGRHALHLGIAVIGAGIILLAVSVTGVQSASTLDFAPSLSLIGLGTRREHRTAVRLHPRSRPDDRDRHPPTHTLAITAWACLVPLALTFLLVFLLPMCTRAEAA